MASIAGVACAACIILVVVSCSVGMCLTVVGATLLNTACHHDVIANVTGVQHLPAADWPSCRLLLVYGQGPQVTTASVTVPSCPDKAPPTFHGCYNHKTPHEVVFADSSRKRSDYETDRACMIAGIVLLVLGATPLVVAVTARVGYQMCGCNDFEAARPDAGVLVRDSVSEMPRM